MKGTVYFVQMITGPIKIGFTTDLDARVKNLGYGVPSGVTVLTSMDGSPAAEVWVHHKFHALRISGEWFRPDETLLSFIEEVRSVGSVVLPKDFRSNDVGSRPLSPLDQEIKEITTFYLKKISEPILAGERILHQINRAADRTHISRTRAKDIWYGDARVISAVEFLQIRETYDAIIAATMPVSSALRNMGAEVDPVGFREE